MVLVLALLAMAVPWLPLAVLLGASLPRRNRLGASVIRFVFEGNKAVRRFFTLLTVLVLSTPADVWGMHQLDRHGAAWLSLTVAAVWMLLGAGAMLVPLPRRQSPTKATTAG